MKKSMIKYEIFSIVFIFIFGVILHYTFDWSGRNLIVGSFSSVNESTWEHLKLIFFPILITIIGGIFYNKSTFKKYLVSKTKGLIYSLIFSIVFFYIYTGILGSNIAFIDIFSFLVSIILSELVFFQNYIYGSNENYKTSIIVLTMLLMCFIIFTYSPPKINLFKDPITGTFGIFRTQN